MHLRTDDKSEAQKLRELREFLNLAIGLSIDNIQGLDDMLKSEMMSFEFAKRLIEGEKLSIIKDIQNFLDFYRGLN